jgi:hypothetical protein
LQEGAKPSKMKPKSIKHVFVGYEDGPRAVRYYDARSRQVRISRNYRFLQNELPQNATDVQREGEIGSIDTQLSGGADMHTPTKPLTNENEHIVDEDVPMTDARENGSSTSAEKKQTRPPENNLPRRTKRKVVRQDYHKLNDPVKEWAYLDRESGYEETELTQTEADIIMAAVAKNRSFDPTEPHTLKDARKSADWDKWEGAINTELTQLNEMGTWELVDPPDDQKIIGNKWVLVKKTNKEGEVVKYKARLVAKGYSQIPGMDYTDTFSPVVHLETCHIRTSPDPALRFRTSFISRLNL